MMRLLRPGRVLVRLLILALVGCLLVGGGYAAHRYRKRASIRDALASGQAAYAAHRYTEAVGYFGQYLNADQRNVDVLLMYADAQLRRRPQAEADVRQAVKSLELALRTLPGHRVATERLLDLYTTLDAKQDIERIARAWLLAAGSDATVASVARHRLFAALMAQQKLDDARKLMDEWLAAAPSNPAALCSSAQLLLAQQKTGEAIEVLRTSIQNNPEDVESVSQLATLLAAQTKIRPEETSKLLDDAASLFTELLARNPKSAQARLARGQFDLLCVRLPGREIANRNADFRQALQDLDEARKLAAEDGSALLELGWLYSEMGLADKAVSVLGEAEKAAPGDPRLYALQVQLALDAGDAAAYGVLVDRILAAPLGERRLDLLPELAELCAACNRVPQARQLIEELRASQPAPEVLLYLEALIDQAEGRLPGAITRLQEAIRSNPKLARAQLLLARAWVLAGDLQRAVDPLKAYVDLSQRSGGSTAAANAQLELARICAQLGRWEEGVRAARDIQFRVPNVRLASMAALSALEMEAQAARRSGANPDLRKLKELQDRLDEALKQDPETAPFQTLKARLLGWQGRIEEGMAILNGLKAKAESRQLAVLSLIDLYADAGRFDQAVRECAAAIELVADVRKPGLRARLVELQAQAGDLSSARQTLRDMEAAGPTREWAQAKWGLAQNLLRKGQTEDARAEFLQLAGKEPRNIRARVALLGIKPTKDQAPSPQALVDQIKAVEGGAGKTWRYWQAVVWLASDVWSEHRVQAESLLKESLAADASWNAGALALGAWYEKAGDNEKAMELYQTQLKANPGNVELARRLLVTGMRLQRWTEMDRVLASFPSDEPSLEEFRVELMLRAGNSQQAHRLLEERIKNHPEDFLARARLGSLKLESGDLTEAERLLDEAARINPQAPEVSRIRVQLHVRRREYDQAIALCNRLLAEASSADDYQLRSQVHEAKGDLDGAARDLQAIAGLPGAAERGFLALGRLYYRQNQRGKSVETWREGLKAVPGSRSIQGALAGAMLGDPAPGQQQAGFDLLTDMLKQSPRDEDLLLMRAEHLARSKPEEAQKAYEEIIRLHPNSAAAYGDLARLLLALDPLNGRDRALELVERGLNVNPRDFDLLRARSDLLMSSSPERALASAREAARIQPQNEPAALAVATALDKLDKTDAAITGLQDFLKRVDAGPRVRTRLMLASLHIDKGDVNIADSLIEEAHGLAPTDSHVLSTRLQWHQRQQQWDLIAARASECMQQPEQRSVVQLAAGMLVDSGQPKYQEAGMDLLQRLIDRYPDDASNYVKLGTSYYSLGKPADARVAWERAIKLAPDRDSELMNNLAWLICEDLKDPKSALAWSDKAMAAAPNDPHVLDTWGVLQYRLGNLKASREALQKCIGTAKLEEKTRFTATFHLARTLATVEPQESRRLLQSLLNDRRIQEDRKSSVHRLLSDSNFEAAQALLESVSPETKPAS